MPLLGGTQVTLGERAFGKILTNIVDLQLYFHFFSEGTGDCVIVSTEGEDGPTCLHENATTSCKSLEYALQSGSKRICLHGMMSNKSEYIASSDSLKYNKIQIFTSECEIRNCTLVLSGTNTYLLDIFFFNLVITNSVLILSNVKISFHNATVTQVEFTYSSNISDESHVQIFFSNSGIMCNRSYGIRCGLYFLDNRQKSVIKVVAKESTFYSCNIQFVGPGVVLFLLRSNLTLTRVEVQTTSPSFLRIPEMIKFDEVKFESSLGTLGLDSEIILHLKNPNIIISKTSFKRTSLTIKTIQDSFPQHFFFAKISASMFVEAYKTDRGGALLLSSDFKGSNVIISTCVFLQNRVVKNSNEMSGYGGAIFVEGHNMELDIEHCIFEDNSASDPGTALYTTPGITMSITNSTFLYNIKETDGLLHSIISAAGTVKELQGSFTISNSFPESHTSSLELVNLDKVLNVDVTIKCPRWYEHIPQYSVLRENRVKANYTFFMKSLSYQCCPCTQTYYTNSFTMKQFTYPFDNSTSALSLKSSEIKSKSCIPCPYGAVCSGNNVVPRPNYWGYWHKNELTFLKCPIGYCCSGKGQAPCHSYNSCAGNRIGDLCGACQEGYSMTILTGKCVSDTQCGGDHWFWLLAFLGTMVYAMWYTFLGNVFEPFFNLFIVKSCQLSKKVTTKVDKIKEVDPLTTFVSKGVQVGFDDSIGKYHFTHHAVYPEIDLPGYVDDEFTRKFKDVPDPALYTDVPEASKIPKSSPNKGYFGIFNNFIQMAAAMQISIEYENSENNKSFLDSCTEVARSFFSLEIARISSNFCPIRGLTTVGTLIYDCLFTFGIYLSWLLVFVFIFCLMSFSKNIGKPSKYQAQLENIWFTLVKGIIKIMKFTYAKLCGTVFISVACVSLGSKSVWWYDAKNVCLEKWQILAVVFGIFYAIPFPLAMFVGMKLIKRKQIGAVLFVVFCLCPGVGVIFVLIKKLIWRSKNESGNVNYPESKATNAVLGALQGPYKGNENITAYWEAMVCLRRLLTTGMKLISLTSVRMMLTTILWVIFLIQHNTFSPFEVKMSNHVETFSIFLLVVTAVVNLLKAFLVDSGVVLSGPSVPFVKGLETVGKMMGIFLLVFIIMIEIKSQRVNKKKV